MHVCDSLSSDLARTCRERGLAWESVFPDPGMTAVAIDRLVHHAIVLEVNTESYCGKAAQARAVTSDLAPPLIRIDAQSKILTSIDN